MRFALSSKRVTIAMTLGEKDNTEDDDEEGGLFVSNKDGDFDTAGELRNDILDSADDDVRFGFHPLVKHG